VPWPGLFAARRWAPAATSFEQAASEAETSKDSRRAEFLVQAGQCLARGQGSGKGAQGVRRGAGEPASPLPNCRAKPISTAPAPWSRSATLQVAAPISTRASSLVPGDPFGWYLSAALAQREGNLARAKTDIQKAVAGAPDDADVLLLAGNVAGLSGELDAARNFFTRAARAAPDSASGKAAAARLLRTPSLKRPRLKPSRKPSKKLS
jgi:tetratricopeptide (TPR) repeat protein